MVNLLTGGFHMESFSDEEYQKTVNEMRRMLVKNIDPTHCTGLKKSISLKSCGERIFGRCIEID